MTFVVKNVGGIDETELTIDRGSMLITGRNASNKTSLLKALLFAVGVDDVPIRTGADSAYVRLTTDSETIERTATRAETGVTVEGDPLIVDAENKDLFERFAALLETNPLRVAVQTTSNFETLLKEPMDLDTLEAERSQKLQEKRELTDRIEQLADVDENLAAVTAELQSHREEVEELEADLDTLYSELPDEDDELETLRQRRTELVSERSRLERQISDIESAVDRLAEKKTELEGQLAEIENREEMDSLRQRRATLREKVDAIDNRIDVLQSALTANREMLDADMRDVLTYEPGLEKTSLECWACGQQASMSSFEDMVDHLSDLVEQERQRRAEYEPELEDIEDRIEELESEQRRQSQLEEQLRSTESTLDSRVESLDQKRTQLADIETELSTLDDELADRKEAKTEDQSEISREIEETRVALETKRQEIERLEAQQSQLREQQTERARARDNLEQLTDEIQTLTHRIENLESELRETFNEAIDDLLDALEFEDIERMWLDGEFDLVIAREVDGTVREDSIEHLAESERSVIGLVLGLAGFLAYDVDTISPVLVLDSLGEFDADRTSRLIEYFSHHTQFLIAAVHPEQAGADSDRQTTVTPGQ